MRDLRRDADDELGHVGGLAEVHAESQEVHAERVAGERRERERERLKSWICRTTGAKQRPAHHSLLLSGEDLKGASGEHLIEHVEEGDGHPGGGQTQGHKRITDTQPHLQSDQEDGGKEETITSSRPDQDFRKRKLNQVVTLCH